MATKPAKFAVKTCRVRVLVPVNDIVVQVKVSTLAFFAAIPSLKSKY